jgi:hypothetical protein
MTLRDDSGTNVISKLARWLLIREQERPAVFYFLLLALLLGMGLALGRGSADALFFKRYGIEHLPTIYALLGLALAATSITYAAFADRLASERLAVVLLGALGALLALCWWLMTRTESGVSYPLFYLVYQLASEVLVMHTALYMSQNFDTQQGKRLFPIVFGALEAGRIVGGAILAVAAKPVGMANLLLVWLALTGASMVLIVRHHRRIGASPFYRPPPRRRSPFRRAFEQIAQGMRFAHSSELVRAQAGALFFLVVSFYVLSYSIGRIVTAHFETEEELGAFLGGLSALTALSALLIQVLVTGRLLERFGLKTVNLIFPVTHLLSHALLLVQFALPAAVVASFNRDSLMPALRNPSRNLLLNVLPDYMQGRVRALLLGLVLPVALVICGMGLHWLQRAPTPTAYLLVGLGAAAALFHYSVRSNRAYLGAILSTLRERLFLPGQQLDAVLQGAGEELHDELRRGLASTDEEVCLAHARLLARRFPHEAAGLIAERLAHTTPPLRDRLLNLLDPRALPAVSDRLWPSLAGADQHYRATLYERLLAAGDPHARAEIDNLLADAHPRLRAAGLYGVLVCESPTRAGAALATLQAMLTSDDLPAVLAALHVLQARPAVECRDGLEATLNHADVRVQASALNVLMRWPVAVSASWAAAIERMLDSPDPDLRVAALGASRLLTPERLGERLYAAFGDPHSDVQAAALRAWRTSLRAQLVSERTLIDRLIAHRGAPRQQAVALRLLLDQGIAVSDFEAIAHALLDDLQQLVGMRERLSHESAGRPLPAIDLFGIVLAERCQQTAELVMLALEGIEDRATVGTIRLGLASRDRRQRANALEALGELRNRAVAARLGGLLEAPMSARAKSAPAADDTLAALLERCAARTDAWLADCARHAATTH